MCHASSPCLIRKQIAFLERMAPSRQPPMFTMQWGSRLTQGPKAITVVAVPITVISNFQGNPCSATSPCLLETSGSIVEGAEQAVWIFMGLWPVPGVVCQEGVGKVHKYSEAWHLAEFQGPAFWRRPLLRASAPGEKLFYSFGVSLAPHLYPSSCSQ